MIEGIIWSLTLS